jgi:transposase InsO family protein
VPSPTSRSSAVTRWRWFARMRLRCPRCLATWGSAGANLHNGFDQTRIDDGVRPGVRLPPIADALADHGITAGEGRHYLCAMKDICPDRLVGCSIDSPMMAFLAVTALRGAVARRGTVAGCAVHADGGGQFRAERSCRNSPTTTLWGRGVCGNDIAMASTFALLRNNVPNRQCWYTQEELRLAIATWIEKFPIAGAGNVGRAASCRSGLRLSTTASGPYENRRPRESGKIRPSH